MNDLISRQAAIDLVESFYKIDNSVLNTMVFKLKQLPTHPTLSNTLGALDCVERRLVSYKLTDLVNEFEEILAHIRERKENDSVCGLCEYDGAYMGQSGDWCNECPGFDKADCFKLKDKYKKEWLELMNTLPSVQPRRGKWIDYSDEGYVECPFCHSATNCDDNKDELHYCFSCGAELRGEDDVPESIT